MNVTLSAAAGQWLLLTMISLGAAGCAGLGSLGEMYPAPVGGDRRTTGQLGGEVQSVDTRRNEIHLLTGWNRISSVRYDGRTWVQYGSRRMSVHDLRRGDRVRVRVIEGRRDRYASRIELLERTRDRAVWGRDERVRRLDGTVTRVDVRGGVFEVRQGRDPAVVVVMPADRVRSLDERFRRLRPGQTVRLEVVVIGGNRMRLVRFLQ